MGLACKGTVRSNWHALVNPAFIPAIILILAMLRQSQVLYAKLCIKMAQFAAVALIIVWVEAFIRSTMNDLSSKTVSGRD